MYRLFLILISLIATNSFASNVTDLYQSQLPVATQAEDERKKVTSELLKIVLLKVVGDSKALNSTDISSILAESEQFVLQYQYHRTNKISDDLTEPDHLQLELKFKEKELKQALADLGLPIWGKSRPEILLWLAIDVGETRNIISADYENDLIPRTIRQSLDKRGLTFFMPLMDLEDQSALSFADLWAGFPEPILAASERYATQVVAMARVTASGDGSVQVRWQLLNNGKAEQWQSQGHAEIAIAQGADELADRTARQFTQVVDTKRVQRYQFQINNINGYADYTRIRKYLLNLQYVSDVQLLSLVAKQLEITVSLSSEIAVLNKTIAIDHVLEEDTAYNPTNKIRYRFLK